LGLGYFTRVAKCYGRGTPQVTRRGRRIKSQDSEKKQQHVKNRTGERVKGPKGRRGEASIIVGMGGRETGEFDKKNKDGWMERPANKGGVKRSIQTHLIAPPEGGP